MSNDHENRPLLDGRLSLEQQKKRAKELLRALRNGDADARERVQRVQPNAAGLSEARLQLADAQHVLARENGFSSWTQLKAHAAQLSAARAQMRDPRAGLDTPGCLHLRCGSDIRGALRDAGFRGSFAEFSDPFCQGPARDIPLEDFIEERAQFIAGAYQRPLDAVRSGLGAAYATLSPERLAAHEEIVLWFEHDVYDQLILAYVLRALGDAALVHTRVSLICVDRVPGVGAFMGLGQLAPEVIRLLWHARTPVLAAHHALGRAVWRAITRPSPEALHASVRGGTLPVAPMAAALARHLRELPSTRHGLSLTEQHTLELLSEGRCSAHALFGRLHHEREAAPFLGDLMYWHVLEELAAGGLIEARPLSEAEASWPKRTVSLTPAGAEVLAGKRDRLADGHSRWLGGVALRGGQPCWRWNDPAGRPEFTRWRPS